MIKNPTTHEVIAKLPNQIILKLKSLDVLKWLNFLKLVNVVRVISGWSKVVNVNPGVDEDEDKLKPGQRGC